jgi:hypothetical protein
MSKNKNKFGIVAIVGALLGSLVLMTLVFQEFDPKFLIFFVILLAIAEIFVQLRWRMTIVCRHCGFDPVLYVKDTQKAVEKVKAKLDARRDDPAAIFARPLHLPTIPKGKAEMIEKAQKVQGSIISRRI